MTASRRLQPAVETGGTLALPLRRWRRCAQASDFGNRQRRRHNGWPPSGSRRGRVRRGSGEPRVKLEDRPCPERQSERPRRATGPGGRGRRSATRRSRAGLVPRRRAPRADGGAGPAGRVRVEPPRAPARPRAGWLCGPGATCVDAVTHERDGDTVEVEGTPVRLSNLDYAERDTRAGDAATTRMRELVDGQEGACRLSGRQGYDREVGTCARPRRRVPRTGADHRGHLRAVIRA